MRFVDVLALGALGAGEDHASNPIPANLIERASVVATLAGTEGADGTLKLQASNDVPPAENFAAAFVPTNWADVEGASVSLSADGSKLLVADICCRYLRVVYAAGSTAGGTITARLHADGGR